MQTARFVLARYEMGAGARRMQLTLVHRSNARMDDLRMGTQSGEELCISMQGESYH